MSAQLPGVFIEVRAEALIVGGPISVGNIGIVGTAASGPVNTVQVLGSYADARAIFGAYDALDDPDSTLPAPPGQLFPTPAPLTLVRALEIAYSNGASKVFAVRVSGDDENELAALAAPTPAGMGATNVDIFDVSAKTPGARGNRIRMTITTPGAATDPATVTFSLGDDEETYTVASGTELETKTASSKLVTVSTDGKPNAGDRPAAVSNVVFQGGASGANASISDYQTGLEKLLNQEAHIILAAGLSGEEIAGVLNAHVQSASTDEVRRDRIAVIGSPAPENPNDPSGFITAAGTPPVASDRVIYVMPGIQFQDAAARTEVTLPGAYAAAAIAGMLSARPPHISLTNKTVNAGGLEVEFNTAHLSSLLGNGVLAIEKRRGLRVVKGITTDTGAFKQITTRRIVDFAKFGVRAAAEPFIGLLNNDRVRKALKGSINGFLADMVTDEMLTGYQLDVTATRDDEIRGNVRVTMTLLPTFSIDQIRVVMFLG